MSYPREEARPIEPKPYIIEPTSSAICDDDTTVQRQRLISIERLLGGKKRRTISTEIGACSVSNIAGGIWLELVKPTGIEITYVMYNTGEELSTVAFQNLESSTDESPDSMKTQKIVDAPHDIDEVLNKAVQTLH